MAFVNYTPDGLETVENKKQNLKLSRQTRDVIDYDMRTMVESDEPMNEGKFINRVFMNFYASAQTSIAYRLNIYEGEMNELFDNNDIDEKTKKKIVKSFLKVREGELTALKDKFLSRHSGESFKIWLHRDMMEYLSSDGSECCEEKFYDRRGQYIKCVLEEYAELPYAQRELVFFADYRDMIEKAIINKHRIRVTTRGDKSFSVFPYGIYQDPLSSANYLVGYSVLPGESDTADNKRPCSLRIKGIRNMTHENSKSGFLKKSEKDGLEKLLNIRGVQFMLEDAEEIAVRLTVKGEQQYRQHTHLRPGYEEIRDGNVYIFNCTKKQAEVYFFKFGKEAEIISPEGLRNKFAKEYKDAASVYIDK